MGIRRSKREALFLSSLFLILLNARYSTAFQNCPASTLTVSYTTCPSTEEAWRAAAMKKNCSNVPQNCTSPENFVYHCVTNAFRNETIEVCAPAIFLLGFCPEYNFQGERIQDNYGADCTHFTMSCPSRYESWKSYQFPECTAMNDTNLQNADSESRARDGKNIAISDEPGTHPEEARQPTGRIILFTCLGACSIVIVGIFVLFIRRRQRKLASTDTNSRLHSTYQCQPSTDSEKEALKCSDLHD